MFGGFQLGSGVLAFQSLAFQSLAFQSLAFPARFTEVRKPRVLVCVYFQYAAIQLASWCCQLRIPPMSSGLGSMRQYAPGRQVSTGS